ncbi:3',5'-cyclic-nucleotide phosphodiesterase pde1 [Emmonsiellopsis sp. PD_33]|nr:3',5'-cyclic-nucleotide phosphodiesterase pde1 [Emmonsiellopsis sp. PD_33]
MHRDGASGRGQRSGHREKATFQIIVLGASGGPREDIVTGILVRSTSTNWTKGSVIAVDAGTLLAGIIRALESSNFTKDTSSKDSKLRMKDGPFAGIELPNITTEANAAYIFREIISSVLVTHPHLDHVSGLAMNTPLVEAQSNPKVVAALPSTIAAIKNHIFNDITWPNLSDEDGGAGLLTYQRLVDGGNPRLGRSEGRGYVKACDGIITKCLSVSHGLCGQRYHPETGKHHRAESTVFTTEPVLLPSRRVSIDTQDLGRSFTPTHQSIPGNNVAGKDMTLATVESSAFFLRDERSGTEIIIFGDIEPDSISLEPRNEKVWEIAAPKIANGILRAIFIECSYTDSVDDNYLYGHLCPRHLIAELEVLAGKVLDALKPHSGHMLTRKRKRRVSSISDEPTSPRTIKQSSQPPRTSPTRRKTRRSHGDEDADPNRPALDDERASPAVASEAMDDDNVGSHDYRQTHTPDTSSLAESTIAPCRRRRRSSGSSTQKPLGGLEVYLIHIKDTLTDGRSAREKILEEVQARNEEAGLGCEFFAPLSGEEVFV